MLCGLLLLYRLARIANVDVSYAVMKVDPYVS